MQKIEKYMRKRLLIVSGIMCMMAAVSVNAAPMVMEMEMGIAEQIDPERNVSISVESNSVEVKGGEGLELEVVSLTGRLVATYQIDSPAQRIELNIPKGCYILKVGKVVRKVTVK